MSQVERRGAVRVPARLAMEISIGGDATRVESLNVSANGVYFGFPSYVEPLTRLRITLDLPDGEWTEGRGHTVSCDGVVVRTEPDVPDTGADEYQIACYFTEISPRDKETLEAYILSHVPF